MIRLRAPETIRRHQADHHQLKHLDQLLQQVKYHLMTLGKIFGHHHEQLSPCCR